MINQAQEDGEVIKLSTSLKNLGVVLDCHLSMDQAISHLRKVCFLEMRNISHIRPLIDEETAKNLILSFVISRLDYCNVLFNGVAEEKLKKLQKIQNHAARLVKKIPKRSSVTPLLYEFHWLPIKSRIQYKTAMLTFQCLNMTQISLNT